MKAIYIEKHGGPDALKFGDVDRPEPQAGEARVRMQAAALNRLDVWVRSGLPGLKHSFPHILGSDGTGVVEALGEGVTEFKIGDRVLINPGIGCDDCEFCNKGEQSLCATFHLYGEHVNGTYAESLNVKQSNLHFVPEGLNATEAAAFPLSFVTSYRMLLTKAKLTPEMTLLVLGIGSGVSTSCLQIAKALGCRVIVTSRSESKLERAASMGADHGILYTRGELAPAVRKLTDRRGVDVVVDSIGAETWTQSIASLVKGGTLVTCGATTGPNPTTDIARIFWNQLTIHGSTMGSYDDFKKMLEFVETHKIKPVVDRVFPFEEGIDAHRYLESGNQFGKIALEF